MAKKYDVNDLVNVIPTLLNDPLGSLAVFLENNQETTRNKPQKILKIQKWNQFLRPKKR